MLQCTSTWHPWSHTRSRIDTHTGRSSCRNPPQHVLPPPRSQGICAIPALGGTAGAIALRPQSLPRQQLLWISSGTCLQPHRGCRAHLHPHSACASSPACSALARAPPGAGDNAPTCHRAGIALRRPAQGRHGSLEVGSKYWPRDHGQFPLQCTLPGTRSGRRGSRTPAPAGAPCSFRWALPDIWGTCKTPTWPWRSWAGGRWWRRRGEELCRRPRR
mmetsp:Transcript_6409/g.23746  ORF Transcript_6409/g.23746 Transcript_6409/m.23746 type:complete len:217 (-) Transcript_6409:319-969(-)